MTDSDRERFVQVFHAVAETYGEKVNELRTQMYFEVLRELPIPEVERRFRLHLADGKFFPRPADILQMGKPEKRDIEAIAARAFAVFEEHNFYDRSYRFEDPKILAACQIMGGWGRCCEAVRTMPDGQYAFFRRDWLAAYVGLGPEDEDKFRNVPGELVACDYIRRINGASHPALTGGTERRLTDG